MPTSPDLYDLLGVERGADAATIKRAYRDLARQYHPDVTGGDPEKTERFKAISAAYEVLTDPARREQYDRYGTVGDEGAGFNGFGAEGFGDLGSILSSFFGFGGAGAAEPPGGPRAGQPLGVRVELTLEEVATGVDREIRFTRNGTCATCFGTGVGEGGQRVTCTTCAGRGVTTQTRRTIFGLASVQETCPSCRGEGETIDRPCTTCRGAGQTPETVTHTLEIAPGMLDGQTLRVAGAGHRGHRGGPNGDLHVQVRIKPHRVFQREGRDLACSHDISFAQAALGDEITVPGILEPQTMIVEPGTQSGKVVRLNGAGLPDPRQPERRGDQYVQLRVVTPTRLSAEEQELLHRFAELRGEHPSKPQERSFLDKIKDHFRS